MDVQYVSSLEHLQKLRSEASTLIPAYLVSFRSYGCHPNAHADIFTLLMVKWKLNVLKTKPYVQEQARDMGYRTHSELISLKCNVDLIGGDTWSLTL